MAPIVPQLTALMQSGDLRALDELVRTCGPRLLAVARRTCRVESDAEDAVQQALLAASTRLDQFRGEGSALAWLSTLVARSCYRLNEGHAALEPLGDDPDCGCHATDAAEADDLADRVGAALMKLSRTDRLAFLLSIDGHTSVEIAAKFGLTSNAVRSRLKRARKFLRSELTAPSHPGERVGVRGDTNAERENTEAA
ncbi:MAG: RNA polymerase sigma factor [Myxococcaceae bacterium]